ncbi:3-phosphoshikimate 1-carboxyvinyltransferase [Desulforamulus reducens MI-1]|uniref:3-phosphoshikimate 1-carboxyvinyltransferase n=1 Tax=Desulforamulus reducens (strain ATCC BAA-1160 / DSM 100696 / MI-1) TaxID=349161 RepID=AROA_DESRM|nr:3-phosphoshikimate 1-carboxyvinyltransferase [Desulforamulus reducens]A4J3N2.1 RecName: Full=3-phosphoshikimate 1-carboxyvinyltransferase; AltName: Full=5-enolpyruvylshikimate-3-phosphate synthase; Short=EPSP synthase; Short=EPSPS [Desulforamulus reducens MI-1]ABO49685.1 3-phosphoshikimate 1-carboxyvinyltransferase [Desulforamulus reducens MI-1]
MELVINPVKKLRGNVSVPGDKSISHRAVMVGALAQGITEVSNFLMGEDCLATVKCLRAMGVSIEGPTNGKLKIYGVGLQGLREPADLLDTGNSGTTTRLLMGILAGQPFTSIITGDQSLKKRPMARVTKPLQDMGASFLGRNQNNLLPMAVQGGKLKPIDFHSPVASAQVKSAVLFAGLFAEGYTSVTEPAVSRDHSERMLKAFGAEVEVKNQTVRIKGLPQLKGMKITVPGDISSAAFLMVAAAILPGSDITIQGVGINPTRDGILEVLKQMGAGIEIMHSRLQGGEPVGDIRIKGAELQGTELSGPIIPRLIDEIPIIAVAAAYARGTTVIRDASELKVKESNRISSVVRELRKFGATVEELSDGLIIQGGTPLSGAVCQSYGDHRMAMAMAVAGLAASGQTLIEQADCIPVSFPGFSDVLKEVIVE